MKVKTFEGPNEQELYERIKSEMGTNAVVLSVKKTTQSGFLSFLKKNKENYIVTAALENEIAKEADVKENNTEEKVEEINVDAFKEIAKKITNENKKSEKDSIIKEQEIKIKELENKLEESAIYIKNYEREIEKRIAVETDKDTFENPILETIYQTLMESDVSSDIAKELLVEFESLEKDTDINIIIKKVYNKIIDIIIGPGENHYVDFENLIQKKLVVFMGPTGVGKTTTIAKLASKMLFEQNASIGLITADTYRVAAVEQLKIYADILEVDFKIAYNQFELEKAYLSFVNNKDIILVDTAGRSHSNDEHIVDLINHMESLPNSEKFLVLSLTTKNEDLKEIIKVYKKNFDFNLIFTKADETTTYGTILNICYLTGKKASFLTNGQSVPNDIKVIDADQIAKSILGLEVGEV